MGTSWVTIAKVAGPLVAEMRAVFRAWAAAVDDRCAGARRAYEEAHSQLVAQGKRRKIGRKVYTSDEYRQRLAAYTDPAAHRRMVEEMEALRDAIEANADRPPIVFFRKYVDPWTIGLGHLAMLLLEPPEGEPPLGQLIAPFRRAVESREGWSGPICIALFTPTNRGRLKALLEENLAVHNPGNPDRGHDWFEWRELYQALAAATESWAEFLEARGVDSAIVLAFQLIGGSWSDEDVSVAVSGVPTWFGGLGDRP